MNNENLRLFCIRGAVCAENSKESIVSNVGQLFSEITGKNNLKPENFVSIQFTVTPDLDEMNPAAALRKSDKTGIASNIPLFCCAEPVVKNMLEKTVRIMISVYLPENSVIKHVYLGKASVLRPDLTADK